MTNGSQPLLLLITGHRRPNEPLHLSAKWKWGPRPMNAVCGEPIDDARTVALPFSGWTQTVCGACGRWMDAVDFD